MPRRFAGGLALLAVLAAAALGASGSARADASSYPNPLYLSSEQSSLLAGSYQLIATQGPAAPTSAPTAALGGAGVLTGSGYAYVYTVISADGGEGPPSPVSNAVTASSHQVTVGNLPTGVTVRLYRRKGSTALFSRVTVPDLVANASTTFTDNVPDATVWAQGVLPQTQNRVAFAFPTSCGLANCGYASFAPGVHATANAAMTQSPLPDATSGKGWIVDGDGEVHFASGDWVFDVSYKSGVITSGDAHLVVGMWKVDDAGAPVGSALIDPNTAGEQTTTDLINTTNATQSVTHTVPVPAFSLGADEHVYIQFWRRQTAAYTTSGSTGARDITLFSQNGFTKVTHPAVSTLPSEPAAVAPSDAAAFAEATPELSATFADPDAGDTGSVEFRVCSSATCSDPGDPVASGFSPTVTNGGTGAWSVSPAVADGSYYWQARSVDAVGGASSWSPARSFTVDTTAPEEPDSFAGTFSAGALTLTWMHPSSGAPSAYVVYVDGALVRTLAGTTTSTTFDPLELVRKRTFAVAAVDEVGNVGSRTLELVRVPKLAGVSRASARRMLTLRGLRIGSVQRVLGAKRTGLVLSQSPVAPSLAPSGNAIGLRVAQRRIDVLGPRRLTCTVGGVLRKRIRLASPRSSLRAALYTNGRWDHVRSYGSYDAGTRTFALRFPYTLERPAVYWIKWTATTPAGASVSSWTRVDLRRLRAGVTTPPPCARA